MDARFLSPPADMPLPQLIDLAWHASFDLLEATRAGNRQGAIIPAAWLRATRDHPRATPALKRMAGHALELGLAAFGGGALPSEPVQRGGSYNIEFLKYCFGDPSISHDFEPVQPCDGEVC